jgi:hypothetical protein
LWSVLVIHRTTRLPGSTLIRLGRTRRTGMFGLRTVTV